MSSEPRNVLAPPNALAWIEGDENYSGRWAYHGSDIEDARRNGDAVFLTEEREYGSRWLPGVTGYAPMADVMHLVGEVDNLRERITEVTTRVQGAGGVLSLTDSPVAGAS